MGKQGPCYHCGVTSTPLWRNGPPDKPVLCNACGSRWRTKGTLVNYTPLHARAEPDDIEDHRVSRVKSISVNKNKEIKLVKRKQNPESMVIGGVNSDYSHGFRKIIEEDKSNRSSSGSAVSNSESCAQFGSGDASDLTGPAQSMVWDSMVPSRKRTCIGRLKPSPVEKLTKDLYTILHEQQSSCFSGSSEEDLLFESETPMVSVEIGHGSVLIRHPNSIAREEESEASSISVDNKQCLANEVYSRSATLFVHNNKGVNMASTVSGRMNNVAGQGMQHEPLKRDKSQLDNFQILGNHNSPLRHVDLNDILTFEEFTRQLTNEEQQQLLKHLPPVDVVKFPYSLKSMFDSPQFRENLTSFQQLLAEGVFDISFPGVKTEDCKTLKRLALSNSPKSKWVERYHLLKKCKTSSGKSVVSGLNMASSNLRHVKRLWDNETQSFPDAKIMKSPKRIIMKGSYENKDPMDYDGGSCFSPKSLFALPTDGGSFLMDSMNFVDESSDQDLLLDVPSNGSFAQAELLHPAMSFGAPQASTSSSSIYPHVLHP
ncbi:GATA transcription factor 26 isoform X2 [Pyrus x bretschneideri]|uniref:GATA transcription factor 26 isoform X2 n=1 Tax=Pyrus x bretschneideri TaxID=225117 RepID=UPI00202DC36D|nr:GATA transcription factor 26 isoform X2 [Pyrus x bretschneideri]